GPYRLMISSTSRGSRHAGTSSPRADLPRSSRDVAGIVIPLALESGYPPPHEPLHHDTLPPLVGRDSAGECDMARALELLHGKPHALRLHMEGWSPDRSRVAHPRGIRGWKLGPACGVSIGIGAAVTRRPLTHHRAYASVHGGSRRLR